MSLMAQWHPLRLALCVVLTWLVALSPAVVTAQPAPDAPPEGAGSARPPSLMLNVYRWATESAVAGCDLPGGLLAAVGEVTSDHGQRGSVPATDDTEATGPQLGDDGTLQPGLFGGPVSDDTDGGVWDGDQTVDFTVGPFQFTPATWSHYGVDANGDGVTDPQNAWDAAAAAADFLCQHGAGDPEQLDAALVTYFGGQPNAATARSKMAGYGVLTGRNTVGEPSQFGTYWTNDSRAFLDRWLGPVTANATPLTIETGAADAQWLVGDWNGDGATTPASFTPNPEGLGTFVFFDHEGNPVGEALEFGTPSSLPLVGDWNADGIDEVGTYVLAGNEGIFLLGPEREDQPALIARFGQAGDLPIIGDWDGDGYDGPGVYRPSTNTFHLADQRGRPMGGPVDVTMVASVGKVSAARTDSADEAGDTGSAGEADGASEAGEAFLEVIGAAANGEALRDIGVLDLFRDQRSTPAHQRYTQQFLDSLGSPIPLAADWDGNGFTDLALVRHGFDVTLVERFDVHKRSMGFVELPSAFAVTVGRWEPRAMPMMSDVSGSTDHPTADSVEVHSGKEIPVARVGGILVHADIADQLAAMLEAAGADGITLTGWGWRSHQRQIELRAQNCADVWETPSSQCSPPTARPGHSRHESGKAIDFHVRGSALTRSTPEFAWLKEHAADYGFFNLPSEAWHWSVDGK